MPEWCATLKFTGALSDADLLERMHARYVIQRNSLSHSSSSRLRHVMQGLLRILLSNRTRVSIEAALSSATSFSPYFGSTVKRRPSYASAC